MMWSSPIDAVTFLLVLSWTWNLWRVIVFRQFDQKLEGKYSLESTDPRESEIRAHLRP